MFLTRIEAGDLGTLGELYGRHARMVYQFALALTRSPDGAEEVVQETFLGLLKGGRTRGRAMFDD